MKQPLVSICIPTYNRAMYLKKTLDSIVIQPEFKDKLVEVVISDNASTDCTEEVARSYVYKYDNIKYYRNAVNIQDENYPLVIGRANGILRKLNNDTVLLKPGALGMLCSLTEKYKDTRPCLFLSNRSSKGCPEKTLKFHDFAVFEGYLVTWIASFTIWDDECENIENDLDGCKLKLWQVKKFYENANKKDAIVICDTEFGVVQPVPNKDISYGLYKVFYENYLGLFQPYIKSGSMNLKDIEDIKKDLLYNFFTGWIIQWEINRASCKYSEKENLKECIFKKYEDKAYWKNYKYYYRKKLLIAKIKKNIKNAVEHFKLLRKRWKNRGYV